MTYLRSQSQYGAALGPEREQNVKVIYRAYGSDPFADGLSEPSIARLMHSHLGVKSPRNKDDYSAQIKRGKSGGTKGGKATSSQSLKVKSQRQKDILKMEGEFTRSTLAEVFHLSKCALGKDLLHLHNCGLLELRMGGNKDQIKYYRVRK
jgi:hypothetical protein